MAVDASVQRPTRLVSTAGMSGAPAPFAKADDYGNILAWVDGEGHTVWEPAGETAHPRVGDAIDRAAALRPAPAGTKAAPAGKPGIPDGKGESARPTGELPASAQRAMVPKGPTSAPDEMVFRLQPNVSADKVVAGLGRALGGNVRVVRKSDRLNYVRVKLPRGVKPEAAIAAAKKQAGVAAADKAYIYRASETSVDDPSFAQQWGLAKIRMPEAWDFETGDPSVVIAVVDTGVDYTHPDLDDGKVIAGYDFVNDDSDAMDDHGHGTHCAGIAAANANDGVGVAGVAFGCRVMAVKVLDAWGSGWDTDVAEGIAFAADRGAKVISLSLGGAGNSQVLHDAVIYARGKGCLVVCAAGNTADGSMQYPSGYPESFSVAATDSSDTVAWFSTHNAEVDIAAPGVGVLSSVAGGGYATWSGTSMATPHVAGVAALVFSRYPSETADHVRTRLTAGASDLGAAGRDDYYGSGRLDALKALLGVDAVAPAVPSGLTAVSGDPGIAVSWSANTEPDLWGYKVYRSTMSGGPYSLIANMGRQAVSYTDPRAGLTVGQTYYYALSAYDATPNESARSTGVGATLGGDTVPPALVSVCATSNTSVVVKFSEPVAKAAAETASNYAIDNGAAVTAAARNADNVSVTLTTSALFPDLMYTLTVNGVPDLAGNPIAADSKMTFMSSPAGLVGYWKLDEGSGTVAADSSGNGNNGTVAGPVWFTGRLGGALSFDGSNDYVDLGTGASLNSMTTRMTLCTWVKTSKIGTALIAKCTNKTADYDFCTAIIGGPKIDFNAGADQGWGWIETGTMNQVVDSNWHHLAWVVDTTLDAANDRIKIYFDGARVTDISLYHAPAQNSNIPMHSSYKTALGVRGLASGGDLWYQGLMDDVRIYSRALSADEVATVVSGGSPATPVPGPVTNFVADGGDGKAVLTWANTTDAGFAGTRLVRKEGGFPAGPADGQLVYDGKAATCLVDSGLTNGVTYYYAAYAHNAVGNCAPPALASATPQTEADPTPPRIAAVTPLPGSVVDSQPPGVAVTFSKAIDPASVTSSSVRLRRSGGDGTFGDGNEVTIVPAEVIRTAANELTLSLAGQGLEDDLYQLALVGDVSGLSEGLVGYWNLNEGSGAVAADTTGNGNNGAIGGPVWTAGRFGGALSFDGSNDYVDLGTGASLNSMTTRMTLCTWVKTSKIGTALIAKQTNGTTFDYCTDIIGGPKIDFNGGAWGRVETGVMNQVVDNNWHHLAWVVDSTLATAGDRMKIYFDGSRVTDISLYSAPVQNSSLPMHSDIKTALGVRGLAAGGDIWYQGLMDDVRIYSRALSGAEVAELASSAPTATSAVTDLAGRRLDGEYGGSFPSGNGEEGGDFASTFTINGKPPSVTAVTPAPRSMPLRAPESIIVTFSERVDPATVNTGSFQLVRSGGDGTFGDGNEVTVTPAGVALAAPDRAVMDLTGVQLPDDLYRVRLVGDGGAAIKDLAGACLDGEFGGWLPSGDGSEGGDFVSTFRLFNYVPIIEPCKRPYQLQAEIDRPYYYTIPASDANGDDLTYTLTSGPAGMTIDPATGAISWEPSFSAGRFSSFAVRVEDGRGGVVEKSYPLRVFNVNQPANPGFETGNMLGWTYDSGGNWWCHGVANQWVLMERNYWFSYQAGYMSSPSDPHNGSFEQTLTLTPGHEYELYAELASWLSSEQGEDVVGNGDGGTVRVYINGQQIARHDFGFIGTGTSKYATLETVFVPTQASNVVRFYVSRAWGVWAGAEYGTPVTFVDNIHVSETCFPGITPRVVSLSPAPGANLLVPPTEVRVRFNTDIRAETVGGQSVKLTRSGGDGVFGNGNDVEIVPHAVSLVGLDTVVMDLAGVTLPDDTYRLVLAGGGASPLTNGDGVVLDGEFGGTLPSGNGAPGGDFVCTFRMAPLGDAIAIWKLDEGSGSVAHDSSGNGNHGTFRGTAAWGDGTHSGTLRLDGGGYVDCGASSSLDSIAGQMTLCAWVRATTDGGSVISRCTNASTNYNFCVDIYGVGGPKMALNGGDGPSWAQCESAQGAAIADGTWHHLAWVVDTSSPACMDRVRFYLDGVRFAMPGYWQAPVRDSLIPLTTGVKMALGARGTSPADVGIVGGMYDARVYRRALMDGEIATLLNDATAAAPDYFETPSGQALSVAAPGVLANDFDIKNRPLAAVLVYTAAHGVLALQPDGSFSYTPDAGFVGFDSFTYKANNGTGNSNVAAVTIAVGPSPAISLSPQSLNLSISSVEDLASAGLALTNTGGRQLRWTASTDRPWLQVAPSSGTTPVGPDTLTISASAIVAESWGAATATGGAPCGREDFSLVWTGTEMIVWGGFDGGSAVNTGGRYNPAANVWTGAVNLTGAPAARKCHSAVWTGSEMVVWGGWDYNNNVLGTGAVYDPVGNAWVGATSLAGVPSARRGHTAVWTGTEMIVWGGNDNANALNTGGRYNPSTHTWTPMSSTNAPAARWSHCAVWAGTEMIVWGGHDGTKALNTGARYHPATDTWTNDVTTTGALSPRLVASAVWTGREMIVWGGRTATEEYANTGGRYDSTTDTWTAALATDGVLSARRSHKAVWTGSEMIVWGGYNGSFLNSGGRYVPPARMADGTYHGMVTVSDPNATNNPQTVSVTLRIGDNEAPLISSFDPLSPATVQAGTTQVFSVNAWDPDGDALSYAWKFDGVSLPVTGDSFSYSPAPTDAGSHTIAVTVSDGRGGSVAQSWSVTVPVVTYTITATAGTGGLISPSGTVTVNHGANQSFAITANGGYEIAGVAVDGASVGKVSIYTFSNVTANHTIAATFSLAAVPPSITSQPVDATVSVGQTATFSVTAMGTAPFSHQWYKGGVAIGGATAASYTTPATTTADSGAKFKVVVSNVSGNATSNEATLTVNSAPFTGQVLITCDNGYTLYFNGQQMGTGSNWNSLQTYGVNLQSGKNVVAVKCTDAGGVAALLAEVRYGTTRAGSSASWKVSLTGPAGWETVAFDDSGWTAAKDYGAYGVAPWYTNVSSCPSDTPARWIWSSNNEADNEVYVRFSFDN
jgi:subtilisin family serine protease